MSTTPDRPDPNDPPAGSDDPQDTSHPSEDAGEHHDPTPAPVTEPISETASQASPETTPKTSELPESVPAPPPPPASFSPQADAPAPPPPPMPSTDQPWTPQPTAQPAGPPPAVSPAYGPPAPGASPAYGPSAPAPAPAYGAPAGAALSPQEEKGWSLAAHLLVLVAGFLAPLIIWLVFKGRGPFLEHHAKESLNFQITVTIAGIVSVLAMFLLVGFVMILVLIPWMIVMPIIAAVKANSGEWYRYPLTLRLIK